MRGKLYLCATPIGNLGDITIRVLDTLKAVDLIAAEDTRRTRKLLTHYGIKKPLVSFHEQNELKMLPRLINDLIGGKSVAQVSDAGMPGIADPGHRLVKRCVEANIAVEVLPGPSAFLTAAVLSGLATDDIRFLGYFPRKSGARKKLLDEIKGARSSLVFYESPRRIKSTLAAMAPVFGSRAVFVGRELTKMFEEQLRGTAAQIAEKLSERQEIKGEIAIVIAGERAQPQPGLDVIRREVDKEINLGRSKSDASRVVAERLGVSRRSVYETAHKEGAKKSEE